MIDTIIGFVATTVFAWLMMLAGMWILEKISLITGSDFFRIRVYDWMHSWKSWAITAAFVFLCILTGI